MPQSPTSHGLPEVMRLAPANAWERHEANWGIHTEVLYPTFTQLPLARLWVVCHTPQAKDRLVRCYTDADGTIEEFDAQELIPEMQRDITRLVTVLQHLLNKKTVQTVSQALWQQPRVG